jgi:hypothetical protein
MLARKLPIAVALLACLLGASATAAYATFTSGPTAAQSISTGSLQAPTGAAATLTSVCRSNKAQQITVTWTASASTYGTGYTIERNGATVATVSSATTSWIDNTVAHSTAYTYTVLTTFQQWSSGMGAGAVTTC